MRFCLFSTQKQWGGGETLVWTLANELEQFGHEVAWVAREGSDVARFLGENDAKFLLQPRRRYGSPGDWLELRRQLTAWSPDVLLLNDTHSVMLAACVYWMLPRPKPLRLAYKHTVFPLRSRLKYRWLCDRLVCVSKAARDTVVEGGLPSEHVAVIHGGCPEPSVAPEEIAAVRRELGVSGDMRLLVSVGNLLKCKGHADLIQALKLYPASSGLRLAIAGKGEEMPELKGLVETLGLQDTVKLLGYRDDPNVLLAAADLVVHPSHAEGLSLVLIQAQMLGKPIVATPVGGAAEVVRADGPQRPGTWLVRPQNPYSLSGAIGEALESIELGGPQLAEQLTHTAEDTRLRFSITRSAQKLVELAEEMR